MRTQELMEKHARGTLTQHEAGELIERLDAKVTGYRLKVAKVRRRVVDFLPAKHSAPLLRMIDK